MNRLSKKIAEGYIEMISKSTDKNYFISKFKCPNDNCRWAIYWLCFKFRVDDLTNEIFFINYRKRSDHLIKRIGKILVDNKNWLDNLDFDSLEIPIVTIDWVRYQILILKTHYINLIKDDERKD